MAHRHTIQKRARGGRNLGPSYTDPGSKHISEEAKSQKEEFATGGGVSLAKAHGGAAKKRGDRRARGGALPFKKGGSVWSHAAAGLRGKKGFADDLAGDGVKEHGELDKTRAGDTEVKKKARVGHGGKASHQYATGGKVRKGFDKGGKAYGGHKDGEADPLDNEPEDGPHGDWEENHAKGGRAGRKTGGRLAKKHGGECNEED